MGFNRIPDARGYICKDLYFSQDLELLIFLLVVQHHNDRIWPGNSVHKVVCPLALSPSFLTNFMECL